MEGPKFLQSDPSDWPRHEREIQQIMTSEEKSAIKDSLKTFQSIMVTYVQQRGGAPKGHPKHKV